MRWLRTCRQVLREAIPAWRRVGLVVRHCEHPALLVAKLGRCADAARLLGAGDARRDAQGVGLDHYEALLRADVLAFLALANVDRNDIARWIGEGRDLDANSIAALLLEAANALR
jgi:hypothetical protein